MWLLLINDFFSLSIESIFVCFIGIVEVDVTKLSLSW